MLVFSYAVELDAADPKADGYKDLLREAIQAYRTRAACLQAKGNAAAAQRDLKRAEKLEAKGKNADQLEAKSKKADQKEGPTGQVTVRNDWGRPLTLFLAGASYPLQAGEMRTLPTPAGSFSYEMQAGPYRVQGTMESGRSYSLASPPPVAP